MEQVRQTADASVEALHVAADFDAFEVIEGDAAEQALGRAATIEGWSLVSLGRVTRRPL